MREATATNTVLAIALLAVFAVAGCVATGGQGIWAIPLVLVAAGCGRLLARSLSSRRYAVSDVSHPDERGARPRWLWAVENIAC